MGCGSSCTASAGGTPQGVSEYQKQISLGRELRRKGQHEEAKEVLKDAQTRQSRNPQAFMELAGVYMDQEDWVEAMGELTMALNSDPDLTAGYILRSQVFMRMGELERADKDCKSAMQLDPGNPQVKALRIEVFNAKAAANGQPVQLQ